MTRRHHRLFFFARVARFGCRRACSSRGACSCGSMRQRGCIMSFREACEGGKETHGYGLWADTWIPEARDADACQIWLTSAAFVIAVVV